MTNKPSPNPTTRISGRTTRLAVACVQAALDNPGTAVYCFDHDHTNNAAHMYLTNLVSNILSLMAVPYQRNNNAITVEKL